MLVHMVTNSGEATAATRRRWLTEATSTRSIEVTDMDCAHLSTATRTVRVDVSHEGNVTYGVAFIGMAQDLGVIWHASTDQPLVAGQFMAMGAEVFATVQRRGCNSDFPARIGGQTA